jgi:GTP pyrophosphokinase
MPSSINRLVEKVKKYNPSCNFETLRRAFEISATAHEGQQRKSGDPFITHPLEVAIILSELEMDEASLVAALLHDTVEDTNYTIEKLKDEFGAEVANLVEGLTKLEKLQFKSKEEQQAENLRKMLLAMAKDLRVIIIKLADRLHNMRTLKYMSPDKQMEKAVETLEIYAPLAHRLGILRIKWELEDLCLRYTDSKGYYDLVDKISVKRKEREAFIQNIIKNLNIKVNSLNIDCNIDGRPKHFYSIYKKMKSQNKTLEQIYDLFAVRVIVNTVKDCYTVLGLVHELFKPFPGRFKDYIAMPKPNMYQSLHTTLIGNEGIPFEVQIRTWEMHEISEVGIAAHWKYKNGSNGVTDKVLDNKLTWLRQLVEWEKDANDAEEFMENLKIDLFTDEVFIFTPKGDVVNLRAGSCPIDFAYSIHSAVGNKMMGAKVNGKIVTLDTELKNGDIVEILTASNIHGPSRDWLKFVKTSQARNKINQWFKKEKREENILRGKDFIEKEVKKQGFQYNQLFKNEWVDNILKRFNLNSIEDIFASVGLGAMSAAKIISRLKEEYRKSLKPDEIDERLIEVLPRKFIEKQKSLPDRGIIVKGIENCLVKIARCCTPVPGDEIIGYITRGRGVSVHSKDCPNITLNPDGDNRLIEVLWHGSQSGSYTSDITISAIDRPFLLSEITNIITEAKISMKALNARTTKDHQAILNISLQISNIEQLEKIINRIQKIKGVLEINRTRQ